MYVIPPTYNIKFNIHCVCVCVCIYGYIFVCESVYFNFLSVDLLIFLYLFRRLFSRHPLGSTSSSPPWSKSWLRSRRPRSSSWRSSRSQPSGRRSYGWASWRRTAGFCERARSTSPLFTTSQTQSWSRSATSDHLTSSLWVWVRLHCSSVTLHP